LSGSYVMAALRTPIGNFGRGLAGVAAPDLGAILVREFLLREVCCPDEVDEVIFGNVLQAGLGMNSARQAAVRGGLPYEVPAFTVSMVCASSLQAVVLADRAIRGEHAETVIAGEFENMSREPFLLSNMRWGTPLGDGKVTDELLLDGLWDCFYDCHMATTVERLAAAREISRREQDESAAESHRRAIAAAQGGQFSDEIVAVDTPAGRLETDEHPRADSSLERLSALKPSFAKDGTITAGNSSGLNDGAAALVLSHCKTHGGQAALAEVVDCVVVGVDPQEMGLAPVPAITELLSRNHLYPKDIGLWEVNEAFAGQVLAVLRELPLPTELLNINGGVIALGHPIGCSGARILVTLVREMARRRSSLGLPQCVPEEASEWPFSCETADDRGPLETWSEADKTDEQNRRSA